MIILSMHLLPRMKVMLVFIFMDSDDLRRAHGKQKQIQNEKFLPAVRLELITLRFVVRRLTTDLHGLDDHSSIKVTFIHTSTSDTNVYIGICWRHDEVERILPCTCTALCYILEYMFIEQTAKRRICHVFALHVQNTTKHSC